MALEEVPKAAKGLSYLGIQELNGSRYYTFALQPRRSYALQFHPHLRSIGPGVSFLSDCSYGYNL
jgi:hypothetical protein